MEPRREIAGFLIIIVMKYPAVWKILFRNGWLRMNLTLFQRVLVSCFHSPPPIHFNMTLITISGYPSLKKLAEIQ